MSNAGRHHGRAIYPDCDIAEMRWMRERHGASIFDIVKHFSFIYSQSYVTKIINGELRANIKAAKPIYTC